MARRLRRWGVIRKLGDAPRCKGGAHPCTRTTIDAVGRAKWGATPAVGLFAVEVDSTNSPTAGRKNESYTPEGSANATGSINLTGFVVSPLELRTLAPRSRRKHTRGGKAIAISGSLIKMAIRSRNFWRKSLTPPQAPAKVGGLEYMDGAELITHTRDVALFFDPMGDRFCETDAEEPGAWLTAFAQFSESPNESYREFRPRFQRCVNRLSALRMALGPTIISIKALQALNLRESQVQIVLPPRSQGRP